MENGNVDPQNQFHNIAARQLKGCFTFLGHRRCVLPPPSLCGCCDLYPSAAAWLHDAACAALLNVSQRSNLSTNRRITMPKGGRVAQTPDCPPFYGGLPDRFGDYDTAGLNVQTNTRREKAGAMARPTKEPFRYRPPVNQWSPQTGMGAPEMRFTDRKYLKGAEDRPPTFKVKGSSPNRKASSYPRAHDCSKFPEYKEDPWDDKVKATRAKLAKERELIERPFKPSGTAPSAAFGRTYTSSIVFRPSNLKR